MASQRHKLAVYNYGATCYTFDEKMAAVGYIRQQPGPYVQPTGPAGGPLKGSTLAGPPPASLPGPLVENPLLLLGLILAAGQQPPEPPAGSFEAWSTDEKTVTTEPEKFEAWAAADETAPEPETEPEPTRKKRGKK